jgi:ABC-type Zn uptake system ZnuABC Zn-binding protein ZnuA
MNSLTLKELAKWLIELVNLAKEHQIDIIFAEPQLGQKAAAVIADEICGRVLFLDPLGGKEVPGRSNYLDLIRYH